MRLLPLAVLCLLAWPVPSGAQAPREGDGTIAGKRPYAGPQYPGKPPPLGGYSDARPPESRPPDSQRPDDPDGRMPPSGARPVSTGTGFVVADGRAVTNNHVIADCGRVTARNARGTVLPARIIATDRRRDLALLAVPPEIGPVLTFRENPPVRRGETVVIYGFPYSNVTTSGPTLTSGDLSALSGLRDNPRHFQITAPVNPGNSGGPMFDAQGNVIGVVVSKLNALRIAEMTGGDIPQNVNFAIKGSETLAFLRANNVQPRTTAALGPERKKTEIDDIANPSTLFLQCYR